MKKLLITILAVFIFSSANAEERVNLICNADVSIDLYDNKITSVSGTTAITIFPESKKYNFEGNSGSYTEEGNLIKWSIGLPIDGNIIDEYHFDRVSGEFTDFFGIWIDGSFKPGLAQKYKCKKTEALF
jgi:hypothetical protein